MRKHLTLTFLAGILILICHFGLLAQSPVKVATVGNSITEGAGLSSTYPDVLQELLGEKYEVRNYGISARTLLKKGDFPYWKETKYEEVLAWNPDIVIIKLGTNDSKPQNWQHKEDFEKDYVAFIESFKELPSKPAVFICYPIPVFEDKWGISEGVVKKEILPLIREIAFVAQIKSIDLYTPFLGQAHLTYDGIHPNEEGAALLAKEIYQALNWTAALGKE